MDIRFHTLSKSAIRLDAIVIPTVFGATNFFSDRLGTMLPWLNESEGLADHSGKSGEVTVCYGPPSSPVPRVILVGLGIGKNIPLEDFHKAVGVGMRTCRSLKLARVGFLLEDIHAGAEMLEKPVPRVLEELV
ncbi:MAG: hypothetical protein LIP28_03740, partial [Deltaproteobacteria bacterium]|nr:hypothetical protein [Deltaproteobacteria bacterium]